MLIWLQDFIFQAYTATTISFIWLIMYGLYLITNDDPFPLLLQKIEVALATQKVALLQYRRKKIQLNDQYVEIEKIQKICDCYSTPFIINDDLKLAAHFEVGVHLGQSDGEIVDARKLIKSNQIIGRTCLDQFHLAEKAVHDGATYVAFGAIYSTKTKQTQTDNISLDILKQAKQHLHVPICAIGGLTVENAAPVIEAGADLCAVIQDVFGNPVEKVPARVQSWAKLFEMKKREKTI